jgi:hypothetical protein
MKEAGVEILRVQYNMDWIEQYDDNWQFDLFDRLTKRINSHGIAVNAVLMGTPEWANPDPYAPISGRVPLDMDEYAECVSRIVERYDCDGVQDAPDSPRIDVISIWNEPNIPPFWYPEPSPSMYSEMLVKSYLAAKHANPNIVVLGASVVDDDVWAGPDFIQQMYHNGAKHHFDIIGTHPYTHPFREGFGTLISRLEATRSVLDTNGDFAIPIWTDEIGWPTGDFRGSYASDEDISDWIRLVYSAQVFDYCPTVFWYTLRGGIGVVDEEWGLVRSDYSPKPQYFAYQEMALGSQ